MKTYPPIVSALRADTLSEAYLEGMKTKLGVGSKPDAFMSEAYLEGMKTT